VAPAALGASGGAPDPDAEADPDIVARRICLQLLERMPRTRAELARALHRRGVPEATAAAVLDRFAEVGLIDDRAFAAVWVDTRHHGRGLGRRALTAELRRRGLDQETVAEAVAGLAPEVEAASARALVARELPRLARLARPVKTRRLVGLLARRGYPPGLTHEVVAEALRLAPGDVEEAGALSADPGDADP
jgi:regulatory protein